MKIFSKIASIFRKKKVQNEDEPFEPSESSDRIFHLKNSDCGLIIHADNEVDVLFTNNGNKTQLTDQEEALMAMALFIKQNGFLDLLLDEFRKLAVNTGMQVFDQNIDNRK